MKATLSRAVEGWMVAPLRLGPLDRNKWLIPLLLGLLLPAGCRDRGLQKARQEASEARRTVASLEMQLAGAKKEISETKAELKAVRQTRDELQEQMDKIKQERDQALTLAGQAKEAITKLATRSNSQAGATAGLEKQIADLKKLVQEQQKIIEELQKGVTGQPTEEEVPGETATDKTPPAEPNETP